MPLFEKKHHKPGINLAPLIDILFILIIFFVISSKLIGESGVRLTLPESRQGQSSSLQLPVLSVDQQQRVWLNNILVEHTELPLELKRLHQSSSMTTLILNIDKHITHGMVIALMDKVKAAGFRKIIFGTESPE